ncbi:threonine--tRNA ligase [Candidatus Parcubacteria bacterium A4]|nr:MAG: threonine--tRNA ligase [Candidatus Parcubacteria bacterium A4]
MEIEIIRHSLAHIMAMAVKKLYPKVKFGIGPAIDNGFYYDFEFITPPSDQDLMKIEKEMRELIKQDIKFKKKIVSKEEAKKLFRGQSYKLQLIKELGDDGSRPVQKISIYESGCFIDLCKGPHIKNTDEISIDGFKLTKTAGAYWKGDEKNKMLTRIYGLAFETREDLEKYSKMMEEAEKRDHRVIGKDLFLLDPVAGLGLAMWKPKGALLWRIIEDFWYKKHLDNGYQLVRSPHIGSRKLWEQSGHWNFYNESMYPVLEVSKSLKEEQQAKSAAAKTITNKEKKEEYLLKPMNCPFHVRIYKSELHSHKELPIRYAECGTVYRYEKSGELSGLTRVRGFTQDDAHIICAKEQVENELKRVANFIKEYFEAFGFKNYKIYLSLRDKKNKDKYAGNEKGWKFTEEVLEKVAKELNIEYEKQEGEAAFYGPKLDYKIKDALGREWQCSTLQFDFNLPERFNMTFINSQGKEEQPFMLHRALMGSFERFLGLLIEQYAGAFPLWLSPVQVSVIPISEKHLDFAKKTAEELKKNNIRVEVKEENDTLGKKIRKAEMEKIPYILIVGDKEIEANSVSVRSKNKDSGVMKIEDFIQKLKREIDQKIN